METLRPPLRSWLLERMLICRTPGGEGLQEKVVYSWLRSFWVWAGRRFFLPPFQWFLLGGARMWTPNRVGSPFVSFQPEARIFFFPLALSRKSLASVPGCAAPPTWRRRSTRRSMSWRPWTEAWRRRKIWWPWRMDTCEEPSETASRSGSTRFAWEQSAHESWALGKAAKDFLTAWADVQGKLMGFNMMGQK